MTIYKLFNLDAMITFSFRNVGYVHTRSAQANASFQPALTASSLDSLRTWMPDLQFP